MGQKNLNDPIKNYANSCKIVWSKVMQKKEMNVAYYCKKMQFEKSLFKLPRLKISKHRKVK